MPLDPPRASRVYPRGRTEVEKDLEVIGWRVVGYRIPGLGDLYLSPYSDACLQYTVHDIFTDKVPANRGYGGGWRLIVKKVGT